MGKQTFQSQMTESYPAMSPPLTPAASSRASSPSVEASSPGRSEVHGDDGIPDNYVARTLASTKPRVRGVWYKEVEWISTIFIIGLPFVCLYGAATTPIQTKTAIFTVAYYYFSGLGITAGYHRLWAHKSYNASMPLQIILALAAVSAVEGSCRWWSRGHRAHHRYTDTDLDPYDARKGFFFSHVGWMMVKPTIRPGVVDISDLINNPVLRWQHNNYVPLMLIMAFVVPTLIAGLGWGDYRGGYFFAGALRLLFVHHSTFCVNSLAHWVGDAPFDDKHSPRNHFITALCTIGEGYHNFHHQFPQDYRNAIKWYQYDPTKMMILIWSKLGLASHLRVFPANEINKGLLTMQLKKAHKLSETLQWPTHSEDLPIIGWREFQRQSATRPLVVVHGYVHDVASFEDSHPGGRHLLKKMIGKDATTAFFGGVYDHSNAAHNLLAMMRVGVLDGGMEVEILKAEEAERESLAAGHLTKSHSIPPLNLSGANEYLPPSEVYQVIKHAQPVAA